MDHEQSIEFNPSDWQETVTVSTQEFDEAVAAYQKARENVAAKEAELKPLKTAEDEAEEKIIQLLTKSGKTKYSVEGVGTVLLAARYMITTPKTNIDKERMLTFFKEKGDDFYYSYVSVNSQTLNKLYNEEVEKDPHFEIPGVGLPQVKQTLRFNKERAKSK